MVLEAASILDDVLKIHFSAAQSARFTSLILAL
jgi:hypothetical protein